MIELFFVTCLIADPDVCTSRSLLFENESGIFSCVLQGEFELARWIDDHPEERIKSWECRERHSQERDI